MCKPISSVIVAFAVSFNDDKTAHLGGVGHFNIFTLCSNIKCDTQHRAEGSLRSNSSDVH